ncbi:MAG: ECF transporter S component [Eubacteriales bacterium]|nr:ECF transporter S component [Eubacteriales bacterium]
MNNKTNKIIMTGLLIALIVTATILIMIPIPFGNGYIHFGDTMIFLSVLILGWRYGAVAAGFGSALADLLIGFAIWAPWTLVIKGLMGVVMGLFIQKSMGKHEKNILGVPIYQLIGMVLAGFVMVGGYYIAEGVIYGNFIVALLGIPWNIVQFTAGTVIAVLLAAALYKTPAKRYFAYCPKEDIDTNEHAMD